MVLTELYERHHHISDHENITPVNPTPLVTINKAELTYKLYKPLIDEILSSNMVELTNQSLLDCMKMPVDLYLATLDVCRQRTGVRNKAMDEVQEELERLRQLQAEAKNND